MHMFTGAAGRKSVRPASLARCFGGAARRAALGLAVVLTFAPAQSASAHDYKVGTLEINHPWSRTTPEGAKVAAGYFTVRNTGTTPDRLLTLTSDISGKAEIHEMAVNAEGVMTMRPVEGGLEIPAGGEVALKPGGYHVMFMELKQAPKDGKRFKGSLTFEKAGTVEVEFAVDAMASKSDAHKHGG